MNDHESESAVNEQQPQQHLPPSLAIHRNISSSHEQARLPFRPGNHEGDDPISEIHPAVSYHASFATLQNHNNNHPINNANGLEAMERVFFHLHSRACHVIMAWTSSRTRKLVEHILLVAAICCFGALLLLHRNFVMKPTTGDHTMNSSLCLHDLPGGFDPAAADVTHLVVLPPSGTTNVDTGLAAAPQQSQVVWKVPHEEECTSYQHETCSLGQQKTDPTALLWVLQQEQVDSLPIYYSYSATKAYLMLPPHHKFLDDHLTIQYVLISHSDPTCFGEPFLQFLIWKCYIGPDTILLNWIRSFHHDAIQDISEKMVKTSPTAHVYNPRTKRLWELQELTENAKTANDRSSSESWRQRLPKLLQKIGVLVKTSFLFFFCTTLVSFTLRETQERMLDFTRELSRRVQRSLPVSDLIATHLIQNLVFVPIMVGMMFFLIEFYGGDKFLAFSISSIVWCVESFSAISLRSSQGLLYFPKFFFLLFLLFHVYQVAFKETGFVYTALTVVWCFMFHSMVFFWHRFELPAVVLGHVTVDQPRTVTAPHLTGVDAREDEQQESMFHSPQRLFHSRSAHATPRIRNVRSGTSTNGPSVPLAPAIQQTTSMSSVNSSSNTGAVTGRGVANITSHPSFSTNSSRNLGLFRNNADDDNSTGSMLYFMGGEVVVHRGVPTLSPSLPRPLAREESNFSLPSASSDAHGGVLYGHSGHSVGLDVSERPSYEDEDTHDMDDEFGNIPHETSMDTAPRSNVTPTVTLKNSNEDNQRQQPGMGNGHSADYYAQESGGGLQAIFESRLTPRHQYSDQEVQPTGMLPHLSSRSANAQNHSSYQRTPPTFPELPSRNRRR
jgi:hypothetical protein